VVLDGEGAGQPLSAEELRTFLRTLAESEPESASAPAARRIKAYNFRSPDKFSREELRALQSIHEAVARSLTTAYSATLGTPAQVNLLPLMQIAYSQFLDSVGASLLYIFSIAPLPGMAVLEFTTPLAFRMVERLLGGQGSAPREARAPTEIEIALLNRLAQRTLEVWKQEWASALPGTELEPHIEGMETDPQFVRIVSPAEKTLVVPFEVALEDSAGAFNLCIPCANIESVVSRFAVRNWSRAGTHQANEATRRTIAERLKQSSVVLVVSLGSARLTLGELLQLAPGDVLRLNTPASGELAVQVRGRQKFRGRPGLVGSKLALQVTGICEGGDDERNR